MDDLFFNWQEKLVYAPDGPRPQILFENDKMKVILAGLEVGQMIPEHPEALGIYHILDGEGFMLVNGERLPVAPGMFIITPEGAARGVEATTRLAFLATRVA